MKEKIKIFVGLLMFVVTIGTVLVTSFVKRPEEFSVSERRKLKQPPAWSTNSFLDTTFGKNFEDYTMDQFPFRDNFRTLKSLSNYYLFLQKDNNGIYLVDGYTAKLNYPLKKEAVEHALDKFRFIYDNYLAHKNVNIFTSVVPDKGYYLAHKNNYPAMDYKKLFSMVEKGMDYAKYINISDCLTIEDYYKTDTHWRQEKIQAVADRIAKEMGFLNNLSHDYVEVTSSIPFYGVYYGQTALPLKSEDLKYLTNQTIKNCLVYNYETGKETSVYDLGKLSGNDPYDVFLSGATALITVINPNAKTDKELILFRDSFGGSIAPLLLEEYSKITLVDIRYIRSDMLEAYIDFNNQDVLFLYSTLLLNESYSFK